MKLTVFRYGTTEITERMAFEGGDESIKLPISLLFFLIETKEKKILVDAGCDAMPGFELFEFQKPVEVLETYGIDRGEITDVIITHAHNDHMEAIRYYPQANIHLHKNDLKSGERYLSDATKLILLDDCGTITHGVEFRHVGGHTAGSGIVLIKLCDKALALCGDECYTRKNLILKIPTGSSCCPEKSRAFVEEYSKDCYLPILFHDPDLIEHLGYKTLMEL